MLCLIEIFGGLGGLIMMIYGLFNSDHYIILGLIITILSFIISAVGHCMRAEYIEDEIVSRGGSYKDPEVTKAKIEAAASVGRAIYMTGSSCNSLKKSAKDIGNPDSWNRV